MRGRPSRCASHSLDGGRHKTLGNHVRFARFATITSLAFLALLGACKGAEPKDPIPNVRLGMAPRDVRERFAPGGPGQWQTALGAGDDTALEWTARDSPTKIREARFEFHLGMLVAIRAHTMDPVAKEDITLTPKTVTVLAPAREGGGTTVTVLARDCPTHKDEAESLASKVK